MKLVPLLLWALCLHQGFSLPISSRAPVAAQQSGPQGRRNPAIIRKVRNSAETFGNSRERPDLTDNVRKRSSAPDEATERSSPTRGDMSVLENEVSVVSREMDTTEAGREKGVATGPRYEVVTDSVGEPTKVFKTFDKPDTTDSEKDVSDPSMTPEIPSVDNVGSVDSVGRDMDTTTTDLKETGVHDVALERKGIAKPDVSDATAESTGETAPGIPDVDKATTGLKTPVSEVTATTETPKTETKEAIDSAAKVTGTDDRETVDVDNESETGPADEPEGDFEEGVGTEVPSPARPESDENIKDKDAEDKDSRDKDTEDENIEDKDTEDNGSKDKDVKSKQSEDMDTVDENIKDKDTEDKDSKDKDTEVENIEGKDTEDKGSKDKDVKGKQSEDKDTEDEHIKDKDTEDKDSKDKDTEVESIEDKDTEDKGSKDKDVKGKQSEDKDTEDENIEDKDTEDENIEDKDTEDKDSKDKDTEDENIDDKDTEEENIEDKEIEDKDSEGKDTEDKDSKNIDTEDENIEVKDTKDKGSKDKDGKGKQSENKDTEDENVEDKDTEEENIENKETEDKDSKDKDTEDKDSKGKVSEDKDSKDEDSEDIDSNDKDFEGMVSKDEDSEDRDSKDKDSEDKDSKGKNSEDKDSKGKNSEDKDSKDEDSRDKNTKDKDFEDKDSKDENSEEETTLGAAEATAADLSPQPTTAVPPTDEDSSEDEDWKLLTTEVDDGHASAEAAEGGPTGDGDKASTPDIEYWVETEISADSHDADNDHHKTMVTSAWNSEGEDDLQTSPTSRPDQVLIPSTDPVKIDQLGGSAQLDSQEQSSIFRLLGSLSSAFKGGQALSDRFSFRFPFSSGMSKLSGSPVADRSLERDAAPASRFPFTTGSQAVQPFGQSRDPLGHSVFADVHADRASRQRSPGRAGLESLLSLFGFSLPGAVTEQVAKNPYPRVFSGYKQAVRSDGSRSVDRALPDPPAAVVVHVHINCPGKTTEPAENVDRSSRFFPHIDDGVASFPKLLPMLMPGSAGTRPRYVADPDSESRSISSFLSGSARPSNTLSTAGSFGVFQGPLQTSDVSGKTAAEEQSSPRIALISPATVYSTLPSDGRFGSAQRPVHVADPTISVQTPESFSYIPANRLFSHAFSKPSVSSELHADKKPFSLTNAAEHPQLFPAMSLGPVSEPDSAQSFPKGDVPSSGASDRSVAWDSTHSTDFAHPDLFDVLGVSLPVTATKSSRSRLPSLPVTATKSSRSAKYDGSVDPLDVGAKRFLLFGKRDNAGPDERKSAGYKRVQLPEAAEWEHF